MPVSPAFMPLAQGDAAAVLCTSQETAGGAAGAPFAACAGGAARSGLPSSMCRSCGRLGAGSCSTAASQPDSRASMVCSSCVLLLSAACGSWALQLSVPRPLAQTLLGMAVHSRSQAGSALTGCPDGRGPAVSECNKGGDDGGGGAEAAAVAAAAVRRRRLACFSCTRLLDAGCGGPNAAPLPARDCAVRCSPSTAAAFCASGEL